LRTLIFDTETTGLANFKAPLEKQPYPVQLACMLKDGAQVYAVCNVIINAGVEVPPAVSELHGITNDSLQLYGIKLAEAVSLFCSLLLQADRIVAHNIDFDLTIMAAAIVRVFPENPAMLHLFTQKPRVCTMLSSMPVLKLPGMYGNYKWPKLDEAYRHLVDPEGFENAHDALADVRACAAVLEAMEEQGIELVKGRQ
jgi:DNA polymerase III subunit epsilon